MHTQTDVDDLTMQIKDPGRVRGSGFIQFPPQRPFAGPVVVQPPTVCTWQQTERVTTGPQSQDLNESGTPHRKMNLNLTNVSRPQTHGLNQPEVSHKKSNSLSNTTVTAIGGEHISNKKLSKSQAKRLRKKRRDA